MSTSIATVLQPSAVDPEKVLVYMQARKDGGTTVNEGRRRPPHGNSSPPGLDDIDLEILGYLVSDARLSQRALARAVKMSPPAVAERIARLEASGVIEGYRATVNFAALGRPMTVIVGVKSERSAAQRDLAASLVNIPEVERVDIVTGLTDLQVRLHVRDQTHLNHVLFDSLLASTEIRHTETYLALSTLEPDNFSRRLLEDIAEELVSKNGRDA